MKRLALLAVLTALLGCGAAGEVRAPTAGAAGTTATSSAARTPEQLRICDGMRRMVRQGCPPFTDLSDRDRAGIEDCSFVQAMYAAGVPDCVLEATCDAEMKCMNDVAENGATYRGPTGKCALGPADSESVPVGVGPAELDASYGRHDKRFSDSPSTKERPIEVCAVPGEIDYLTAVTCDDGSKPFADRVTAHAARTGNVGKRRAVRQGDRPVRGEVPGADVRGVHG